MAILFPDEQAMPNSSLAHYLALAAREFGTGDSAYFVGPQGMDFDGLRAFLRGAEASGEPCAVLGASYSFVHFLDALAATGERFRLPAGSRLLDTGGYKSQSRELPLEDFYAALAQAFGVPRERCINMYGMTELSTQLYDEGNAVVPSVKSGPALIRSRIVDPLTAATCPRASAASWCTATSPTSIRSPPILTEDVGVARRRGFLLLGRAEGAQARGLLAGGAGIPAGRTGCDDRPPGPRLPAPDCARRTSGGTRCPSARPAGSWKSGCPCCKPAQLAALGAARQGRPARSTCRACRCR
jgi:hypothetical protein